LVSRPKPAGRLDKKIFTVEMSTHARGPWKVEGIFPTEAHAREYAKALDHKHNHERYIRVTV
ncbi:MAG: hypothetical protein KGJ13_11835, partial [Patescibacteria group bacterium]|nr:hypothetical protein [Patescibacteria group bacterium]